MIKKVIWFCLFLSTLQLFCKDHPKQPAEISQEMRSAISSMLIFENPKLIVDWTPKAGCTALFSSLFKNYGLWHCVEKETNATTTEQTAIHVCAGKYVHRCQPTNFFDSNYYKIKVVRNPYKRAVSAYLYLISLNSIKLTFEKFLVLIKKENWYELPITFENKHFAAHAVHHTKPQWRPTDIYLDAIIHLEKPEELQAVNAYIGLNLNLGYQASHHATYFRKKPYYVGDLIIDREAIYPPFYAFYSPTTLALVEEIYEKDIITYGYSCPEEIPHFIHYHYANERPLTEHETWNPLLWKSETILRSQALD